MLPITTCVTNNDLNVYVIRNTILYAVYYQEWNESGCVLSGLIFVMLCIIRNEMNLAVYYQEWNESGCVLS